LAVVFKKQEISEQVLFHNFYLIDVFDSNNQGRNHGRKVEILELIQPLT